MKTPTREPKKAKREQNTGEVKETIKTKERKIRRAIKAEKMHKIQTKKK